MIPQMVTFPSLSQRASTSSSSARSRYLSTSTGLSGSTCEHEVRQVKREVRQVKREVRQVKCEVREVKREVRQVKREVRRVKCEVRQVKREVRRVKREVRWDRPPGTALAHVDVDKWDRLPSNYYSLQYLRAMFGKVLY